MKQSLEQLSAQRHVSSVVYRLQQLSLDENAAVELYDKVYADLDEDNKREVRKVMATLTDIRGVGSRTAKVAFVKLSLFIRGVDPDAREMVRTINRRYNEKEGQQLLNSLSFDFPDMWAK